MRHFSVNDFSHVVAELLYGNVPIVAPVRWRREAGSSRSSMVICHCSKLGSLAGVRVRRKSADGGDSERGEGKEELDDAGRPEGGVDAEFRGEGSCGGLADGLTGHGSE